MSLTLLLLLASLLHTSLSVSLLTGDYIVQMKGACATNCSKEMNHCLQVAGMTNCTLHSVERIRTKSWGFVSCPSPPSAASRRARSRLVSEESADVERALRLADANHTHVTIERVDSDGEVGMFQRDGPGPVYGQAPTAFAWGRQEVRPPADCASSSRQGEGIDLYVLDTGCDADVGALCTSEFRNDTCADEGGHGTHVAAIAASKRWGIAPRVKKHCLKVLKYRGQGGSYQKMIRAVGRVVREQARTGRKGVVNMSFGGERYSVMNDVIHEASCNTLYFAVAAGNSNMDACMLSPASASKGDKYVYTVAAHDRDGRKAYFTNYGECTDISAPGVNILSENGYRSGTSMSAPFVAGAIAGLLSDGRNVSVEAMTGTRVIQGIDKPALNMSCSGGAYA